jgi:hypothetical protein
MLKVFKNKKQREAEAADKTKRHIVSFFTSDEGKRLLTELLVEALAQIELRPFIGVVEPRLKEVAAQEVANLVAHGETTLSASATTHAHALKQLEKRTIEDFEAAATANADALKQGIKAAARRLSNEAQRKLEKPLMAHQAQIAAAVTEQLPMVLRQEVAWHVRSGPLLEGQRSNRELALAHGVSIREIKRRRRYGYFG